MARHRNVRTMNIDDEYDDEDTAYGHSVPDDNYCISPGTAAQFTFNRDRKADLSSFMGKEEIPEEEEENEFYDDDGRRDSAEVIRPILSDKDQDQLNKCLEEIRGVVAETFSEQFLVETVIAQGYDTHRALDKLLSKQDAPKPQREPRPNRRNRSQGDDYSFSSDDSVTKTDDTEEPLNLQNNLNKYLTPCESHVGIEIKPNNPVFRFNSPLLMLKKALGSKSPSDYGDVPALVPNQTLQKDSNRSSKIDNVLPKPQCGIVPSTPGDRMNEDMGKLSVAAEDEFDLHEFETQGPDKELKSKLKDQVSGVPSKMAKLSLGDVSDHKQSSAKQPSLADLNKKHSSKQPSLADLSKKHSTKQPSLADLSRHHSSKQPSLADLSKSHSTKQPSLADLSRHHSSKQPSLADLSKNHSSKQPSLADLSKNHSSKQPSLADLSQKHSSKHSLLSKHHSLKHGHGTKDFSKDKLGTHGTDVVRHPHIKSHRKHSGTGETHTTSKPRTIDPTKAVRSKSGTHEESVREVFGESSVDDVMDFQDDIETSDFQFYSNVNPKLQAASTSFSKVLAKTFISRLYLDGESLMFPSFCYKRQARHRHKSLVSSTVIVPFDFTTSSPDDIVKAKQKEAFTASSRKPLT